MFKGAKKEDLRRIASELELCVSDKLTVLDFMDLIKNCDRYKNDPDSVHELANLIIEERKYDESQQLELEKIREKSKLDLEIARIRANDKDNNTEVNCNDSFSVDSLIKSIRTLTVKIPDKPEGWSFFFIIRTCICSQSVTDKFKPEILLNLLGEKAANINIYLKDEDLKNYDKIKSIILQEFEPTPQSCLENFKNATRQNCESHVQFASRLTTNWEYYLKLRNVSNFEVLKQLIVSDKIFSTLDKETASHISVRQANKWFDPLTLGKEIDLFYSSRGKPLKSSFVNLKFFVNAAKKHHSSLCFSGDPNFTSERVIQPSSLGGQKEPETEESSMSQLSAKASVFKPINYIGEISKESQGVGDLFTATSYVKSKSVLLATAICFIRDSFGKMQEVRALLDGGSTSNFISQQCMNRLNLKREKINILVSGLNNSELTIKSRVNATIANRGNSYETNADFFVVPRITDMIPSQPFNVSLGNFSREKLADENFNIPGNIDLLLGAEIFYEILLPGQTNLLNTKLIFQNTVFGYIASGSIPVSSENKPHCGLIKDNVDLEKTMRRFWEIENVEPETIKNKETIICEEHFQKKSY
ncbi:DUF1758 domain-containing protein [Trichonephila clavipes]|nr:DUF1758 domain-containing protein [Trichonephila clavipes]